MQAGSAAARYDAAIAGLAVNNSCADPQMHLVNEAYLLSARAPAEHDLGIGNWQRDFERANMLLTQCTNWPGLRGTRTANDCITQVRYNQSVAKNLSTRSPSSQPRSAPATSQPTAAPATPQPTATPTVHYIPPTPPPPLQQ